MWNLLAGYGGMVSIGQQAFFGLGGYAMLMLANFGGLNPFLACRWAAVIAALAALPVSCVAFRLQGGYFAIGTWVIAEVFRLAVANTSALGGGSGTSLTALRGIAKGDARGGDLLDGARLASSPLVRSSTGSCASRRASALLAIRDNEVAAESQGIDVRRHQARGLRRRRVRLPALAGALYFLGNLRISPDAAFSVNWTAFVIFIVVIGGIGTHRGADRRHAPVLRAARGPRGLRRLVPDRPRPRRRGHHARVSAGALGLGGAAIRPVPLPRDAPRVRRPRGRGGRPRRSLLTAMRRRA